MATFFAHDSGPPTRFPHELKFANPDDAELMRIPVSWIVKAVKG
jgi:hypothetical protein